MKYWVIDYINKDECELVCDDQLYATEEEAQAALERLPQPDLHEVNWYSLPDLYEIYDGNFTIDDQLRIFYPHW